MLGLRGFLSTACFIPRNRLDCLAKRVLIEKRGEIAKYLAFQ